MKRLRTFVLCCCLFLLPAAAAAAPVVGLYGVPAPSGKERTAAFPTLREAGANAVFVPADGDAIKHYRKLGFRVFVALNAFGGSGGWKKYPDARPVKADGRLLGTAPEDKGQEGMCPSHAGWRRDRIGQIESVMQRFGADIDGIFLDYVRYPGFWEKPAPNLPDTCYCPRCLEKFQADTRIRIADRRAFDAAPAAWIAKHHPYEWMKWKKGQISSFVREAKEAMQAAVIARLPKGDAAIPASFGNGKPVTPASSIVTPALSSVTPSSSIVTPAKAGVQRPDYAPAAASKDSRLWIPASAGMTDKGMDSRFRGNDKEGNLLLGLFVVPWTKGERNADVSYRLGQDAAFLSEFADVLSPMAYHRMCGEPPAWVEKTAAYFKESAHCAVWPIVQSADTDPGELAEVLRGAGTGGADGILVFHYGGMQKAKDPAAMWKALAAFSPPRNLLPNPEMRVTAGANAPEGWRFGRLEQNLKTLDSRFRGNDNTNEPSAVPASASVTPASSIVTPALSSVTPASSIVTPALSSVTPAKAGVQRPNYAPGAADKDPRLWIPASAGMTDKGMDSRFRGNDKEKSGNAKSASAGMIKSAETLDAKLARPSPANAAGITGSRDGLAAWSAEIPACKPGEEYLFTGFFYRDYWDNLSYPRISAWGETFELDNHVFSIKSFQLLRAHIACPPAPAENRFRFINDAPGQTFWMAKPALVKEEPSPRKPDAAAPQLFAGFFPLGVWGANRGNLEQIRSLGINTVLLRDEGEELHRTVRKCRELALRFVLSVPQEPERLRIYLDGLADLKLTEHEAAFYVEDEPELRSIPIGRTHDIRRMIRDRFPKIAACMAVVRPQACRDYLDAADFFMMDQYPVPFRPMTLLSDSMDRAAQDTGRDRLLSVIQAFGGGDEAAVGRTRWPTWEEMDCLAFLSVIHGSRGVFFFSFSDMGRNEDGRERLARVAGRLNAVYPWLQKANDKDAVSVKMVSEWRVDPRGRPAVQAALRTKDGERLLIAVNTIGHRVSAEMSLPANAVLPPSVTPAKAGVQRSDYAPNAAGKDPRHWIPASAGRTEKDLDSRFRGKDKTNDGNAEEVFGSGAYPVQDGVIRASFAPFETKAFLIKAAGGK